jgi:uncharacterized protein (DUF1330 family)
MTKAYLVGNITVTNPEGYAEYQKHVPKTIADFGGCYLVRGGATTQMEGESHGGRNVVLEFPSCAKLKLGTTARLIKRSFTIGKNNSTGNLILVDGYSPD